MHSKIFLQFYLFCKFSIYELRNTTYDTREIYSANLQDTKNVVGVGAILQDTVYRNITMYCIINKLCILVFIEVK